MKRSDEPEIMQLARSIVLATLEDLVRGKAKNVYYPSTAIALKIDRDDNTYGKIGEKDVVNLLQPFYEQGLVDLAESHDVHDRLISRNYRTNNSLEDTVET